MSTPRLAGLKRLDAQVNQSLQKGNKMLDHHKGIILDLDTELEFGKYQGMTIAEIAEDDPDYIVWLRDAGYEVTDEAL